uniref:Uncharacterized protein n=1 Tax=Heterorhabditis bacteriophora TaxID=37862 RepID=A0A1I7WCE9_HETBA
MKRGVGPFACPLASKPCLHGRAKNAPADLRQRSAFVHPSPLQLPSVPPSHHEPLPDLNQRIGPGVHKRLNHRGIARRQDRVRLDGLGIHEGGDGQRSDARVAGHASVQVGRPFECVEPPIKRQRVVGLDGPDEAFGPGTHCPPPRTPMSTRATST